MLTRWFIAAVCSLMPFSGQVRGQVMQPAPVGELVELEPDLEAEEEETIETDRDSFTPATTTVGFRRMVIESAWSFIDNRAVPNTNSLPELVTRYGLNDWLELRLGWNFEAGGAADSISTGG